MIKTQSVKTKKDFHKVIAQSQHVLTYYWAEWCNDCKRFAPHFEKLVEEYKDKLQIVKLNIDHHREISDQYAVMSIPTLMLFKDGAPVARFVEERSTDSIRNLLENELNKKGGVL
jgi:thioredoxin 1